MTYMRIHFLLKMHENAESFKEKQGKVEITRCVIYVPAASLNPWTGINEFVAAKDIYII